MKFVFVHWRDGCTTKAIIINSKIKHIVKILIFLRYLLHIFKIVISFKFLLYKHHTSLKQDVILSKKLKFLKNFNKNWSSKPKYFSLVEQFLMADNLVLLRHNSRTKCVNWVNLVPGVFGQ